jgi:integrase
MPRKPNVHYWQSRKGYYVKLHGQQHRLASGPDDSPHGPTYLAAVEEYRKLMEVGSLPTAGDGNTVRVVLDAYLQAIEGKVTEGTFNLKRRDYLLFADRWGTLACSAIKPLHAQEIISEMRRPRHVHSQTYRWNDPQVRNFLKRLKAAFNWAVKHEYITRNPLVSIELPEDCVKREVRVVTTEQHTAVLKALRQPRQRNFRNLVIALENTGARPGELANARVANWDDQNGCIVHHRTALLKPGLYRHKTARKKDRVIHFRDGALVLVRELIKGKKPEELIFPNRGGGVYGDDEISHRFARLRKATSIEGLTAKSYRHTLITRLLMKGVPVEAVGNMMGNSPAVIRKHYAHLLHEHKDMRAYLARLNEGT